MSVNIDVSSLETRLFINNEFVDASSGSTCDAINPATEEIICSVQEANEADVNKAVEAAVAAFHPESKWRTMPAFERGKLIYKLADLLEEKSDFFATISSLENGKPASLDGKKYGAKYDMQMAARCYRYYAGWADKLSGTTPQAEGEMFACTVKEPVGVCGLIIPWNFPLVTLSWKLGPALAAGCTCVIKNSEKTPLSAIQFAKLIKEAGFPPGVVNIICGPGGEVGKAMSTHPHVNKISFTGSTAVGKSIQKYAAENNLKRITLELGGKSPVIVLDDAPIEEAVKLSLQAIYQNQGECCTAGTRLYVHEKIYDEFAKKFVEETKKIKLSHGFDPEADLGPIVDKPQMERILNYIKKGKEEGAELLCGGERHGDKGYFVQPTVFGNVTEDMTISREEIFGPVQCLSKFSSIKEVIKRANDTEYGLAAGIISPDIGRTMKIAKCLSAGTVWINTYNRFDIACPFGGYKQSGVGREKGYEVLEHYLETKTIMFPCANLE